MMNIIEFEPFSDIKVEDKDTEKNCIFGHFPNTILENVRKTNG